MQSKNAGNSGGSERPGKHLHRNKRCMAFLTISEDGLITLQLEGALRLDDPHVSWEWDASRWLQPDKRIIGRLGKFGDEGHVLLQGLFRTDFSFHDEPARQSYEANFCLKQ